MIGISRSRRMLGGLSLSAMITAAVACTPYYTDVNAFSHQSESYSEKPYVIEPPDAIRIIAPNAPELDQSIQQLRPDGYITLHLIGDMLAAGRTPTLLGLEIEEKVAEFYEDVKVQVQVEQFNSKAFYMGGETTSGPVAFTGNDTVLSAVMRSGLPRTAWPEKAVLIRPNEDGELTRRVSVDLKQMIETGDLSRNFVLEEGDIVFVPINPLAQVGVMIQNVLTPVQPAISAIATPGRAFGAAQFSFGGTGR